MTQVNIHEAKTHFASLLQRALDGEEIIVAKHGKALVRLVPVNPLELLPRQFGRHRQEMTAQAYENAIAPMGEDLLGIWIDS
jgi:prevent-host-death family protein